MRTITKVFDAEIQAIRERCGSPESGYNYKDMSYLLMIIRQREYEYRNLEKKYKQSLIGERNHVSNL